MAFNYCLGFIDLLGQRDSVRGQSLLPTLTTEEEKQNFHKILRETIGVIDRLQKHAETMLGGLIDERANSPFRNSLPEDERVIWDEMQRTHITRQRWSDGLAVFVCLGDQEVKCPMNGIYGILTLCGSLCFLGLAMNQPVRGAIDVAWGVELHTGELYGPVVARAYELESEVAQYPRVVIGENVIELLKAHQAQPATDHFTKINRSLAELCLGMLILDIDGRPVLHYLGDTFRDAVTQAQHQDLYDKAHQTVIGQLKQHQREMNTKLSLRYGHLFNYFQAHRPSSGNSNEAQQGAPGDAPTSTRPKRER